MRVRFHHEPAFDDEQVQSILRDAVRRERLTRADHPLQVSAAYDGMRIEL